VALGSAEDTLPDSITLLNIGDWQGQVSSSVVLFPEFTYLL
jgi:hypothetical protein